MAKIRADSACCITDVSTALARAHCQARPAGMTGRLIPSQQRGATVGGLGTESDLFRQRSIATACSATEAGEYVGTRATLMPSR